MAKIKLTKTELKAQTDALKRFQRFLPMLQLKKQQLQGEIAAIIAKTEEVTARERAARAALSAWTGLLATGEDLLGDLVKVTGIEKDSANIAGVEIPVFKQLHTTVKEIDLWETPAWIDDAVGAITELLELQARRAFFECQRALIAEELRTTSQRVNLFEKVKIPQCKENIRVIKIAIGDEQTAAVTRGKIAKSRGTGEEDAA